MDDKIYTRNRWRLPSFGTQNKRKKLKQQKLFTVLTIMVIAFSFAYYFFKAIEPMIEKQCKSMAKSIATKISNQEATKVMENYTYNDLLTITKDEAGNVKMVETNMIIVNEIISEIPIRIQKEMEKSDNNSFYIRLGSFLGMNLLAGRGPKINIKMEIVGDLDTNLKSEFVSTGINQTMHKIYLEIQCNVSILTPNETIEEQISNQVLLAQGLIVGDVPSTYYNIQGIGSDKLLDTIE